VSASPSSPNSWHYGPTATDPYPGKRWHYGCGGEVLSLDGGDICSCGQQWNEHTGEPTPGTRQEPAREERS
jgi:hypothetical protein